VYSCDGGRGDMASFLAASPEDKKICLPVTPYMSSTSDQYQTVAQCIYIYIEKERERKNWSIAYVADALSLRAQALLKMKACTYCGCVHPVRCDYCKCVRLDGRECPEGWWYCDGCWQMWDAWWARWTKACVAIAKRALGK